MSQDIGKTNEKLVQEWLIEQGYKVLNMNEAGFPDLLIMKGDVVKFFVEVKGGKHKLHPHQKKFHGELEIMSGIPTKTFRIKSNDIIEE